MSTSLYHWLETPVNYRNYLPNFLVFLGLNNKGVEIGVDKGEFSEIILCNSNLKILYSVDPWKLFSKEKYNDVINISQEQYDAHKHETEQKLSKFGDRSKIFQMTSEEAVKLFKDESLDFVYIDANHKDAKQDIELWYPKVRAGGILAGHDYIPDGQYSEGIFGVKGAVDEFVKKYNYKLFITNESWNSWYIIK